jgi:Sulfatase
LSIALVAVLALGAAKLFLFDGSEAARPAAKPSVVLLLFDEFPADVLLRPDGSIDAERYPNFAALAGMSTWFPNGTTVFDSTFQAVPAIYDARLPRKGTPADRRAHPRSVYDLLDRHGYRVVDVESGTALCPRSVCPGARTRRPGVLERLSGGGRPERFSRWLHSMRRGRPSLYVQHALLPHEPWIYLPSGKQTRPSGDDPVPGINRPIGFHDPALTTHNEARHLLQAGYVDRQIGKLLGRLRRTGLLRRAVIVVAADHGYSFELGVPDRRKVTESNVDEIAPVPFFVKAPGQRRGRVDPSYVRTVDIVPTIADLLGIRVDWAHEGRSAFSPVTRLRRFVRIPTRSFDRVIRIRADELERRRYANRLRRARSFGTGSQSQALFGSPWAMVYRTGPNRELLGRRVARLPKAPAGALRAKLHDARLTRRVDRTKRVVPVKLSGVLTGGRPDELHDVAISVNGRVRAVGRSFHLRGRPEESFSVLVPEIALRDGYNVVRIFGVRRSSPLRLVPLGRN